MEKFDFPDKLLRLVKLIMESSQCYIKLKFALLKPFNITNGLKQGDSLACLPVNITLEKVIGDSGIQTGSKIFINQ
jgi:sorting nexin-29